MDKGVNQCVVRLLGSGAEKSLPVAPVASDEDSTVVFSRKCEGHIEATPWVWQQMQLGSAACLT